MLVGGLLLIYLMANKDYPYTEEEITELVTQPSNADADASGNLPRPPAPIKDPAQTESLTSNNQSTAPTILPLPNLPQTQLKTELSREAEPEASLAPLPSRQLKTFSSFRHRNFRLFWSGAFVSNIGNWMQTVAQNWLVLSLTHSAFLLGLVSFLGSMPLLILGLFGGVVADRNSRRRVLLLTQNLLCLLTMLLAVLTWLNIINIWLVVVIALGIGVVGAFNSPAYQTIMLDMVGREDLMNAIALNSMQFNLTRVIGPSIAGALIVAVGTATCFFFNSLSFLAVVIALLFIKLPPVKARANKKIFTEIKEALGYLKQNKPLAVIILLGSAMNLFVYPYLTMLSVFASNVFHSDAGDYGLLLAAVGVGAAIGSLAVASLTDARSKSRMITGGTALVAVTLVLFSLSHILWVSMLILPFVGAAQVIVNSAMTTIVQTEVPESLRGRVISVNTLASLGVLPLGNLLAGTLAQLQGAPFTVGSEAVLYGLIVLAAYLLMPRLRDF